MNSKHPLYKRKIKLQKELEELYEIQSNQNWIELEKPYKSGYYMTFDLRDDIKNRDDAWVFYEIIRLVGTSAWYKNKSFKKKIKKGKFEYIYPEFGQISEKIYENIHPAVKKYFSEMSRFDKNWNPFRKQYACRLPSYFFVYKTEPRWITHYKEHDSLIAQQIEEIREKLYGSKMKTVNPWYSNRRGLSDGVKFEHKSDRNHNKKTLKRNLSIGDDMDQFEYRYDHRHSALWSWW